MSGGTPNSYLRNAVMTASPEQLHLMLYDGAIRFSLQARDAIEARDLIYHAAEDLEHGKIALSRQKFEEGFARWRKVLDAHPDLLDDDLFIQELVEDVDKYRNALRQDNTTTLENFILQDVLDRAKKRPRTS